VAHGILGDGQRLAFLRARGESQVAWEGLLGHLRERGLRGEHLNSITTDGCVGLAVALAGSARRRLQGPP
jgi:hypothetical protein